MANKPGDKMTLQQWAAAGGDVPKSFKGREKSWANQVKKFAAGGEVFNTVPDMSDGGQIIDGPAFAGGGIAKLAKMLKGTQEALPAAQREANLQRMLAESKAPMRLYHGTMATEGGKGQEAIRRIKPSKEGALGSGVYLTPQSEFASTYAGFPARSQLERDIETGSDFAKKSARQLIDRMDRGVVEPHEVGGNMLPVYAQIKNPLILDGSMGRDPMVEALVKLGMDKDAAGKMVENAYERKGYIGKEVESRARAAGYDGLMQYRDGNLTEVVSYNPNAVKSAIGNIGTFDVTKPDLSKAEGGDVSKAAFGVFPHMKRKRTKQDPEAAKNVPVDLARGFVAGALGMPGDIESLARLPYELITGKESPTILPTSGDIEKRLPFKSDTPVSRLATEAGQLGGGFYTGPLSGARAAVAVPKAVVKAGKDFVQSAGQSVSPLTVYQGSPHKFAPTPKNPLGEFDASKIGTGEGAQAYGHGHYLAEAPDVAEGYAKTLSSPRNRVMEDRGVYIEPSPAGDGKWRLAKTSEVGKQKGRTGDATQGITDWRFPNVAAALRYAKKNGLIAKDEKPILTEIAEEGKYRPVRSASEMEDPLYNQLIASEPGYRYTVDLPDEKIARMLDWDKPLSEQPEVIKALKGTDYEVGMSQKQAEKVADQRLREEADEWAEMTGGDPVDFINNADWEKYVDQVRKESGSVDSSITGQDLHRMIMRDEGYRPDLFDTENYQVGTSEALRSYGIPGIRYLDQSSRGASGTGKWLITMKNGEQKVYDFKPNDDVLEQMGATAKPTGTSNFVVFPGEEDALTILERKKEGGEVKMAEGGAAFGVFPQMKPRRSKQDPEAAKTFPIDVARGFVSGALGMPGDIESLVRMLPGFDEKTILPTSEDIEKRLPFRSDTPAARAATGMGQIGGGFYTGPLSGARAAVAVPKAVMQAGRDFVQSAGQPAVNVIKPKGGNWLTGNVEKQVGRMKMSDNMTPEYYANRQRLLEEARAKGDDRTVRAISEDLEVSRRNDAINNWIDRNLTNYIKKEMATPEDPVRKLAEEGILHIKPFGDQGVVSSRLQNKRMGAGFSPVGEGKSEAAKFWERQADISIDPYPAGSYKHGTLDEGLLEANPWLKNVPDEQMINYAKGINDLGFDHIVDVLRQDVRAGRIRPEQLSKVSMEQAVRRTYDFDQDMAKKMREAQIKATEGMPVHKEYPEGYKWVELKAPELKELPEGYQVNRTSQNLPYLVNPEGVNVGYFEEGAGQAGALRLVSEDRLKDALKYEGETMGHCVGGYCPDVLEGRSRIYSLRDAKGEPHVTIEVNPSSQRVAPRHEEVLSEMKASGLDTNQLDDLAYDIEYEQALQRVKQNRPPAIVQIKGKQNKAPKEEYLPFVQDFVRGGKWSEVGDLGNTGLMRTDSVRAAGWDMGDINQPFLTKQEYDDLLLRQLKPEGMKAGGEVKMAGGGKVGALKGLVEKLARAPAKSKQEIEAVAQRVAPQITGEFVRGEKGTASVAEKTQKQFAREKNLPVSLKDDRKMPPKRIIDPEELKDTVVTGIQGDPTITGKSLESVGDIKLGYPSPQHGGPLYGLGRNDNVFWASGLGPASGVQRVAKEASQAYDAPVLGQYIMMGPESINYAQHFADANLQAIDLSKMNKRQIEQFNKLIRFGDDKSGPRPGFPGIEDKESAYLHLSMDPHLRRHFNRLMQMPTVTERLNLPSGQDIRFAVTEPELRNLETGVTGFSMGRLAPDVSKSDLPLSAHPTYSHDIPGEFIGGLKYPTPYELTFPDTLMSVRANPKQAPQEFGSLKMVGPRQIYDQQMIDELKMYEEAMKKYTGKKKGGAVKSGLSALAKA